MSTLYDLTQETKEITLKAWTGSEYTPDMFSDLVEFWLEEVRCMNEREYSNSGMDYTDRDEDADEMFLFAD